ncbi:hypothetical protein PTNB73_08537 [Pyrenophora teres f. teres]|uniref:Uncharacterized protein n=2 Tax=Pyrenophora teres f. teres TaxID=97479 RepID=E3RF34_PYRTT|nr:hypothetical protein PTT_05522 [Pyrenophora teres f. teres 0-1]KAE8825539.1 hypothetical protein HRS9139_08649 [Pyrenophora teres f. teres]KAE8834636.1 hypothetical protein PTNB85_05969 [Pyrenophora teres f. teres]KAE8843885.1 hypothetical protein HRS9122_04988 [Pyrenophora teres f. teres]KAE8859057.1 hypothetical protein PTNB73_08537 [Pyrenophora teres f. teres]
MFSKISIALLAASASAAVLPRDSTWEWNVDNFSSVCTAATCYYSFNVSAPAGPNGEPSFDANFCYGNSVQDYKSCGQVGLDVPGDVQTKEINLGRDVGATVLVQYTFTQGEVRYTYTGNRTVEHTGLEAGAIFTITPSEVSAVA